MKTVTRRQLSREPSVLSNIKPGESVEVPDGQGGLIVTRKKKHRLTAEEMMAQLDALTSQCPAMDTKAFLDDEE